MIDSSLQEIESLATTSSIGALSLDEIMSQFSIQPKMSWKYRSHEWFRFLPKYFRRRAEKSGIAPLFLLTLTQFGGMVFVLAVVMGILFLDGVPTYSLSSIFVFLGIVGGGVTMIFSAIVAHESYTESEKARGCLTQEGKREVVLTHFRGLIDQYRDRIMREDSDVMKTEARLKKDIEEVESLIEEIADLFDNPPSELTEEEGEALLIQNQEAEELLRKRRAIFDAHQGVKTKFLDYLRKMEKKLGRVDVGIAMKHIVQRISRLRDNTQERLDETQAVFLELITSFVADATRLEQVVSGLQELSRASYEVQLIEEDTPRVSFLHEGDLLDVEGFFDEVIATNVPSRTHVDA